MSAPTGLISATALRLYENGLRVKQRVVAPPRPPLGSRVLEQHSCLYGLLGGGIRRNWMLRSRERQGERPRRSPASLPPTAAGRAGRLHCREPEYGGDRCACSQAGVRSVGGGPGGSGGARPVGRSDGRPERSRGAEVHGRCPWCGRPLLPVRRQRWVRRPALRPRAHLHAASARPGAARRPAERGGDDRPGGHAEPGPIQPRSARPGRAGDHRQREAGQRGGAARWRGRGRGRGLLAGAGRRGPHLGAHDPAPPQDQAGADGARRSSPTAVRPPGRKTSRAPSTAG